MAKMFYTIDEVAAKLKKTPDEVKAMAKSGQIQEFRDRDKLMFKVDQIDLLAGGDEESGEVHLELEDTSGGSAIGLTGSGLDLRDDTGIGLADSREGTGISVFDTDHGSSASAHGSKAGSRAGSAIGSGMADAVSGETQVGADAIDDELSLESVGSGSGLLDLTRESDDTSLGAELLEEVYSSDENIEIPANASGLFEAASTEASGDELRRAPSAAMPMVIEVYDGAGSGLGAGLLVGALVAMICLAVIAFVGIGGATPGLATTIAGNLWVWTGGLAGIAIIAGLVGLFLGKASE
jgi:hypothetical protein